MSKPKNIYLIAQYMMKPQPHANTSKKGWMDNPENVRYDEQVAFTRGLRPRDMNAQVMSCIQAVPSKFQFKIN